MKNNNNDTEVWIYDVVRGIAITIGGGIFFGICLKNFIKFTDSTSKVILIPFLICGLAILMIGVVSLAKGLNLRNGMKDEDVSAESVFDKYEKLDMADNFFSKLSVISVLLFWFGALIVFDYFAIKQGELGMLAFTLIFWIVGIFFAVINFKRRSK